MLSYLISSKNINGCYNFQFGLLYFDADSVFDTHHFKKFFEGGDN